MPEVAPVTSKTFYKGGTRNMNASNLSLFFPRE